MPATQIRWSALFNLTEIEFIPEPPVSLKVSDEIIQTISWLTAATKHDRKLLRCNEQGALLVADAWSNLNSVETDELHPADGVPDTYTSVLAHQGVLVSTSGQIILASFLAVLGGVAEDIYISPNTDYFYPHSVYSIVATCVPASGGTASYVGITAFN